MKRLAIALAILTLPLNAWAFPDNGTCRQDDHEGIQNYNPAYVCDSMYPNTVASALDVWVGANPNVLPEVSMRVYTDNDAVGVCTDVTPLLGANQTDLIHIPLSSDYTFVGVSVLNFARVGFYASTDCTGTQPVGLWLAGDNDGYPYSVWTTDGSTGTRIITVSPYDGEVVATSSPETALLIGGTGFITDSDYYARSQHPIFNVQVKKATFSSAIYRLFNDYGTTETQRTWEVTSPGDFDFITNASSTYAEGLYTLTASIKQPTFSLFGINLAAQTLVSTSSTFVIGSLTNRDLAWLASQQAAEDFENTASSTATGSDCLSFNIALCVQYLFLPSGNSGNSVTVAFEEIKRKPPFGYFTLISNALSTTTVSSTSPLAYVQGAPVIATMFSVLIGGLGTILFLMLAVFLFRRISLWDWHV